MIIRTVAIYIFCTLLAACQTTRPPVSTDGFCALGLFYPEDGAESRFTEGEMREVIARNETTEKLCGL